MARKRSSRLFLWLIPLAALLAAACSGSGSGETISPEETGPQDRQGLFLDQNVRGLGYACAPSGFNGVTNPGGLYNFQDGDTVWFYLGSMLLGSCRALNPLTPVDLVAGALDETDPRVTNLAMLLQTLDFDGNPDNGIEITKTAARKAADAGLDLSASEADFEAALADLVAELIPLVDGWDGAKTASTPAQARAHLNATLKGRMAGSWSGEFGGEYEGTFALSIQPSGQISGRVEVDNPRVGFDVSGTLTSAGVISVTGGTLSGRIHPASTATSGNWVALGATGWYSGTRTSGVNLGIVLENAKSDDH